ncbi:nuclear pore complex protein Nup98-Nup96-like isoform 1-T2 [Podargus strigoides]
MFAQYLWTPSGGSNGFGTTSASGQNFGPSTSSGGLFGTSNTTSNPFGSTSGSLFGPTSFTAASTGTRIKFNPPTGIETGLYSGVYTTFRTWHQCITAMKEYESKSLEELRLEDYQVNRKGPSNPVGAGAAAGWFGSSATKRGFSYGQNKTAFGTNAGFGTTSGGAFGTSAFGPNNNTGGPFGSSQTKPGGFFGWTPFNQPASSSTSTGFGFGTSAWTSNSVFGTPSTDGGPFSSQNNAFAQNQPAGFGSTTGFGTGTTGGLFGQPQTTSLFNNPFGQTTATQNTGFPFVNGSTLGQPNPNTMGLFGVTQPSQPGGFFGAAGTGFGSGAGLFGQPNTGFGVGGSTLFGNNPAGFGTTMTSAPSFGTTPGGGLFGFGANTAGNSFFGNNPATLGFGAPQPAVGKSLTDTYALAAQQAILQQHLLSLSYSPYGESPLFRNPLSEPKKKEERLKPTNPAAQKALTTRTPYRPPPLAAVRVRPKALQSAGSAKCQLFDGLDDEDPLFATGAFMPRRSIKRLCLKRLNIRSMFSPIPPENEDLASLAEMQNGRGSSCWSLELETSARTVCVRRRCTSKT